MPDRPIAVVEDLTVAFSSTSGQWIRRPIAVTEAVTVTLSTHAPPPLAVTVVDQLTVGCLGYATLTHTKRQRWNHKKH